MTGTMYLFHSLSPSRHVFFAEYKCVKKGSQQDVQAKQHGSFWDWENPFDFKDI